MSLLEVDIAVGNLARVARIRVRTRSRLRHGQGGRDARHDGRRKEKNAAGLERASRSGLMRRRGEIRKLYWEIKPGIKMRQGPQAERSGADLKSA